MPAPTNREEAIALLVATRYTVSGMLAVARAFPLPGEAEETLAMIERVPSVREYYDGAQDWLDVWGVEPQF